MSMTGKARKSKELVFTRVINYPVEQVWKAWADPGVLTRWWGPKDFTSRSARTDFRVGGKYLWNMHGPDGKDYYSAGVFKEIVPMRRIVYTDNFADAKGNIVPASAYGMAGDWPEEPVVTIEFEKLNGKTRMTTHHTGLPDVSRNDAAQGWNESLDKMEEALK